MHLEDSPDPARRTLHVIGRTYSQPHKYFYRRYAHQMWTPWEPVSAEIEGDHLAPVIWRDRLYLFWVTFMGKPDESAQPGPRTKGGLGSASLPELMSDVREAGAKKRIDMQLHWSEYLQGEWSTSESGSLVPVTRTILRPIRRGNKTHFVPHTVSLTVPRDFDFKSVFIHVSKEQLGDGEEGGVFIHLGGTINQSFYLAGRNSVPQKAKYSQPASPYTADIVSATRFSDVGALKVSFQERITTEPGKTPPKATPSILQQGGAYTVLPCDNNLTVLGVSEDAFQNAANSAEVQAAMESGIGEIVSLMKPVFYQDDTHTLFVEPEVTERTIEEWQEWVTRAPQPEPDWVKPDWWKDIMVVSALPSKRSIPGFVLTGVLFDPGSLISPRSQFDWLVNPATALEFDGALIGPSGRPALKILATDGAAVPEDASPVNVNPGSGLATGSAVVLTGGTTLEASGLAQVSGGLNVIGRAGFNAALEKNFSEMNRIGFDTRIPSGAGTGR